MEESQVNEFIQAPKSTLQDILQIVEEEETRLAQDISVNEDLLPKEKKRGVCSLVEDKEFSKFLLQTKEDGSFEQFIKERRTERSCHSMINHCSQFVTFVKFKNPLYQQLNEFALIEMIVLQQPGLFHEFLNHLLRSGGLQPGTIQNRIDSLQYLIEYCRCKCENHIYYNYSHIIERLKEERGRFQKITKKRNREKSLDYYIKSRQWISSGVEGLREIMIDSWRLFDSLVSLSCFTPLTRVRYSWALSYVLSSLWCLNMNARVKSIENLTMKELDNIAKCNFHLSTNFKTSNIYHYQVCF